MCSIIILKFLASAGTRRMVRTRARVGGKLYTYNINKSDVCSLDVFEVQICSLDGTAQKGRHRKHFVGGGGG